MPAGEELKLRHGIWRGHGHNLETRPGRRQRSWAERDACGGSTGSRSAAHTASASSAEPSPRKASTPSWTRPAGNSARSWPGVGRYGAPSTTSRTRHPTSTPDGTGLTRSPSRTTTWAQRPAGSRGRAPRAGGARLPSRAADGRRPGAAAQPAPSTLPGRASEHERMQEMVGRTGRGPGNMRSMRFGTRVAASIRAAGHLPTRVPSGVSVPSRRTPSRMGRGGPLAGTVTSTHSSSP